MPQPSTRNVSGSAIPSSLKTRRLAFPAWVLAYRYREELYRVVISRQDPKCVRGKAPFSIAKLFLVIGLVLGGLLIMQYAQCLRPSEAVHLHGSSLVAPSDCPLAGGQGLLMLGQKAGTKGGRRRHPLCEILWHFDS